MTEKDLANSAGHLKRKLERYLEDEAEDHKVMKVLSRLDDLEMTRSCLEVTGLGKVVNSLRKQGGVVGDTCRDLVTKWKDLSKVPSTAKEHEEHVPRGSSSNGRIKESANGFLPDPPRSSASPSKRKSSPFHDSLSKLPKLEEDPDISSLLMDQSWASGSGSQPLVAPAEEAYVITSRKARTTVFSGKARARSFAHVPRLEDLCLRVVMDQTTKLLCRPMPVFVPYYVLKQALEGCTPPVLRTIEENNPHLIEDTDELWMKHCEKDFKITEPDDLDTTFREMYEMKERQREDKLESLKHSIKAKKVARDAPVRQTIIATVDPRAYSKGPRLNRAALTVKTGSGARAAIRSMAVEPAPSRSRSGGSRFTGAQPAKKSAPLMAKSLKAFKNSQR